MLHSQQPAFGGGGMHACMQVTEIWHSAAPVMFAQLSCDLAVGCAHFVLSEV